MPSIVLHLYGDTKKMLFDSQWNLNLFFLNLFQNQDEPEDYQVFFMRQKKKKTHTTKKRNKNKTQSNGDRATRWEQLLQSDAMWHALNSVLLLLIWICLCAVYRKSHSSSWHQMTAQSDNLHFILIAQSFKSQLNYCLAVYIIYSLFVCLFCCNPRWISPYRIVLI